MADEGDRCRRRPVIDREEGPGLGHASMLPGPCRNALRRPRRSPRRAPRAGR
jgi:hypothetical protein